MAFELQPQTGLPLRGIFGAILRFRFLVVVMAAALMVLGIIQLRHMPVDVLPEFSPPYVEIQTEALGLSTEEVEQFITVPLEHNLLNGVSAPSHHTSGAPPAGDKCRRAGVPSAGDIR